MSTIATEGAPKSAKELAGLLIHDLKVKVAGVCPLSAHKIRTTTNILPVFKGLTVRDIVGYENKYLLVSYSRWRAPWQIHGSSQIHTRFPRTPSYAIFR